MFDRNRNTEEYEVWEDGSFRTGCTNPPKSRRGLVAVLLAAVIFLGGIVSVLGVLNIHLFRRLQSEPPVNEDLFQFSESDNTTTAKAPEETVPAATTDRPSGSVQLQQAPQGVENIPQAGGLSLQEIYAGAIDSVVSIICTTQSGSSTGTGVILSADGYVVTNAHVVENARSVEVLLTDGTTLNAQPVGQDAVSDLAVLYVQHTDLQPATFGDSAALRVGDAVVAIGDPLGTTLRGTMTDGIVSAINRDITTGGRTMTLIQTNAALNSGNSGGPLLNCYGQVIGINTMKIGDYVNSAGVEGLGFAIPSTTVKDIVDQLIEKGYVSGRPTLGLTLSAISSFDRLYYRLPQGLYISAVTADSDADQKGIVAGDVLLALGETRITDEDSLNTALYSYQAGDTVPLLIYRRGVQYTVSVVLEQVQ